jgi:PAS domain S-box-containing protein
MTWPRKSSIRRKVTTVIMRASIAVLLVTVAAFMTYDLLTFRQTMVQNLLTQARTIAENSTGDLAFGGDGGEKDARDVLNSLRTNPHIVAAALYDAKGAIFAKYRAADSTADVPAAPQGPGYEFGESRLAIFQPVVQSGKPLGTVYLQSDLTALSQRFQVYGAISFVILASSLVVAFWLSTTLQWRITNPIVTLAVTAQKISEEQNYSLRAPKLSDDELGLLTDSFNTMLDRIQASGAALRASEAQFRFVTDQAKVSLAHLDCDYRYKFANQNYAERYGLELHQIIGKHAAQVVGIALFEKALPYIEQVLAGQQVQFELESLDRNSQPRWSRAEYTPEKNAAGEVVGFVAVHVDITERKKIEQAVRESERRESERAEELSVMIEAMPVPVIIVHDRDARHMTGNHAADNLVRIPGGGEISISAPDDLKPNHFKSFKDGRELRPDELPGQRAARGETVKDFEFELVFDDGTVLNLLGSGTPLLDDQGQPRGAVHTLVDITERKRVESMLRQNEALFSALVELAPTGMYVVDGQFRLQQINARALPAFAKVEAKSGRDFGEVMAILWGTEVGAQLSGIFRHTLATGEPYRSPRFAEHRVDLNEDKAYEWETQRVTLPDGTHGVVCYFNDITETERNHANLAFLATINDDLLRLDTVDAILNTVCAKICEYLRLTIGCFVEINEAADTSHVTHEWRLAEVPGLIGTYKLSDYLSADFQKILRAGECFIVRDTAADPRTDAEKYAELKIRSFICVPLIADGRWKFMFNIHDSKPRDWREDEIRLLRELTERIWTRLERVRADSLLRQNEALFATLIEEAPVGVYVVNAQFRLQQINTRALPAFENVEPKMGRTLTEVMHIQWGKEAGDELAAIFRHTLDTGEPYISPEYSNIRADLGVEKNYEWQLRRVTLPNGSHGVVCYFNDITQQRREARASQQLAAIVESSADAIISKNLNSIITSWNYGAERLFGYSAAEAIGRPITILIPEDHLDEEPKILERVRRGERIEHCETIRRRKDGKLLEISLTVSPITNADGTVIGASKIARDITEQKQAERELERAHKEVVAASNAKDDFLAALSHELRTPLNPVLLLASEAAEDPELPAAVRAQFATVRNNVELEARLIDDLLDLTRITRGKLSLNQQPLDVHEVLQQAIGVVRTDAATKKITLALDFRAEECNVFGDAVRLQQIFWNVLKNAVKFTPTSGKVTVKTFTQADAVFIEIIDTGIGMNPDELKRVFNAFTQGDHAEGGSHRFGGLGLGLAISQKLVELHSGFIQAASAGRDQGAIFTIKLPLSTQTVQKNDTTNPTPSKNSDMPARGNRILLVEDHEPTRTALAHLLSRRNFEVLTAASVMEARELASKNKIDLLISDIGLPDGSGYTLMIELRKLYMLNGIALTGYGMEEDVAHSQKAGFVAHLTKPVRIQSLDSALATALTQIKRIVPG